MKGFSEKPPVRFELKERLGNANRHGSHAQGARRGLCAERARRYPSEQLYPRAEFASDRVGTA
jgi:hypothetical protein